MLIRGFLLAAFLHLEVGHMLSLVSPPKFAIDGQRLRVAC